MSSPPHSTPHSLRDLGEDQLLRQLLKDLPCNEDLLLGPGDDCALVRRDEDWDGLLKTDVVIEGVHFLPETPAALIGRKALARAISDIAAMGGIPEHALITLLAHPTYPIDRLMALYQEGITPLAQQYGISLAGGETAALPQPGLIINVALTGRVERGRAILRSGARAGDIIAVTGPLGGSFATGHHLSFAPRLTLARALMNSECVPSAMMDLSDGLACDLPRLAQASGLGFQLDETTIPRQQGCSLQQALCDGEDYELLLAFRPEHLPTLSTVEGGGSITPIGTFLQEPSIPDLGNAWQHFL